MLTLAAKIGAIMSTFTKHLSLAELQSPSSSAEGETPILRTIADARAKDYAGVCCPLTTEAWRERWRGMCLLPMNDAHDKIAIERKAEAWRSTPAFERDEVTLTRLGEWT